ncbi:MAG: protein kinase [Bryobacteraceae bacterium]
MRSLEERAEAVYQAAKLRPLGDQSAFVERSCRGDEELLAAVHRFFTIDHKTKRIDSSSDTRTAVEQTTPGYRKLEHNSLAPGDSIGPYHVVELLGTGGMGEVYKALDPRLGRHVAVKVLASQGPSAGFRSRFLQEARAAASLNHPNIAHVYEIADAGGTCYIAMEFVDGETLRQKMNAGAPLAEMLRYLRDAANALERAHVKGIVHCDLKPDNIMVSSDGVVKVLDFGLAKLVLRYRSEDADTLDSSAETADDYRSVAGFVEGTLGYMSPEQVAGERMVDQRSDIFSFGCLLFEVATRRLPFASDTPAKTMHRIASEPAPRLSGLCKGVSPALQEIIDGCLEKDPDHRVTNMNDVARALDAQLSDGGQSETLRLPARTSGLPTPNGAATHKKKWVGLATAVALTLGAVSAYRYWFAPAPVSSVAVLPFSFASGAQGTEYLADGMSEDLIRDLSQLPGLKVISRGSSFRFKGKDEDVRTIAKSLDATLVVNGRITQAGDRFHIAVELVNADDGTQTWGAQYDPSRADLPKIEGQIAHDLGERIRLRLTQSEQSRLRKSSGRSAEAYELLLRGRYQLRLYTAESRKKAVEYYLEALQVDPNYALANAELAHAYRLLSGGAILSPGDTMPKAEAAARRALASDPQLAEGHVALADILKDQWKWEEAGREYRRAMELSPNLTMAHIGYAIHLSMMGQSDEAVSQIARARGLDPLGLPTAIDAAAVYYNTRRYDQARELLRGATTLDPAAPSLWLWTGIVNGGSGRIKEAVTAYEKAIGWGDNTSATMCFYASALARAGQRDEARRILREVEKSKEFVPPSAIAVAYLGLGDKERAIQLLQKAYDVRDPIIQYISVESHYDPLKSDPRFQEFVQKLGLPR